MDRGPSSSVGQIRLALAEDRLADAEAMLDAVSATDPRREACVLGIALARGRVGEVARSRPTDRWGRRIVALARSAQIELGTPLGLTGPSGPARPGHVPIDSYPRILHVVTNSLPLVQAGSTIRTHRILRAQCDLGWRASAVTRPGFPVVRGDLSAASPEIVDGIAYHRLLPTVMPSREGTLAAYVDLLDALVASEGPDVLHPASDHVNAAAALIVGRRRSIPVVYEVRAFPEDSWLSRHRYSGAADSDLYRMLSARHDEVIRASDVLTTLGARMRDHLIDRGADPERIVVVPNSVDAGFAAPAREAADARGRLGIEAGELLVGSVTTMYSYEGLETIIEAAAMLRSTGTDVRVMIVGSGPARDELAARAARLGVPLHLPGAVPFREVMAYFDALDVFCLPRVDDRVTRIVTGLKPLEAQARARPVIGSDLPAVAEVLAPGADLAPAGDVGAWAAALGRYVDPQVREVRGDSARRWVLEHRTWPAVVEGYRRAYAMAGVT
jgi:glycosyltransferase involved in cell wall biosynthesis